MGIFLLIVVCVFIVIFFWSWSAKGNSAKDGATSGGFCVIILLVAAFTVLFVVSEMKSCASRGPSSDYYDAPRK